MLQLSPPFVAGASSSHQRIECSARCFFTSRTSTISMVSHPAPTLRSHIPLPTLRSQKIRRSHQSSARRRLGLGVCLASAHTYLINPLRPPSGRRWRIPRQIWSWQALVGLSEPRETGKSEAAVSAGRLGEPPHPRIVPYAKAPSLLGPRASCPTRA